MRTSWWARPSRRSAAASRTRTGPPPDAATCWAGWAPLLPAAPCSRTAVFACDAIDELRHRAQQAREQQARTGSTICVRNPTPSRVRETVISEYPSGAGKFTDLTRTRSLPSGGYPEFGHRRRHQPSATAASGDTMRQSANRIALPMSASVRVYTGSYRFFAAIERTRPPPVGLFHSNHHSAPHCVFLTPLHHFVGEVLRPKRLGSFVGASAPSLLPPRKAVLTLLQYLRN